MQGDGQPRRAARQEGSGAGEGVRALTERASAGTTGDAGARIVALDGLRGVAASIVVLDHCFRSMARTSDAFPFVLRTPLAFFVNGAGAVQVFFVLSGFVLATSLSRTTGRHANARFLVRRVFRIYPPYWFAVTLCWLASFAYVVPAPGDGFTGWFADRAAVDLPITALAAYVPWPGDAGGLLPVGWTLGVEVLFSLLLPILLLVAERTHWVFLIALSGLALQVQAPPSLGIYNGLAFALGIALARERESIQRFFTSRSSVLAFVWIAASLFLFLLPSLAFPIAQKSGVYFVGLPQASMIVMVLGAAGMLAATVGSAWLRSALGSPFFAFPGRISYSLYLLHFPVLVLATRLLARPPTVFDAVLLPVVVFAVTIPLAALAFRFVEKPAIEAGARVARRVAG